MTCNSRRLARPQAFTLLEVMMAATVLLMGIVGMTQVIISGSEMLDVSRKQTIATQMIHTEIDDMRLSDWNTVLAWPSTKTSQIDTLATTDVGYPELLTYQKITQGFAITRTRAYVTGRNDMLVVTFTVTWTGNTGRAYSRTGTSYFGKYGLSITYRSP